MYILTLPKYRKATTPNKISGRTLSHPIKRMKIFTSQENNTQSDQEKDIKLQVLEGKLTGDNPMSC